MIKIIIFSDSFKHFETSIKEYEKRLWREVEIIKLKPSKKKTEKEIIIEETNTLKEKLLKENGFKILLYINWDILSTEKLWEFIESKFQNFSDIVFIVWWAYWVDYEKIKENIDFKLSFSPMTFPHILAYLILLEQIYRILMIKKWTQYHH